MGRLLDSIGAALGLKPSDRVDLATSFDETDDVTMEDPHLDCESCRLTGSSVLAACSGYTFYNVWKNPNNLEGKKLRNYKVFGVTLATGGHQYYKDFS